MKKRFVFVLVLVVVFLSSFASAALAADASLSLSPKTKTIGVGDSLAVDVNLDTDGAAVSSVDVVLDYPTTKLEYVKTTATTSFPNVSVRDDPKGTLHINLTTSSGTFTGVDKIATITFKALATGQAPITFVFTQGSTTDDSNVNSNNQDILATVSGGTYTITTASSGSSVTSATPTPASTEDSTSLSPTPTLPVTGSSSLFTSTLSWSILLIGLGVIIFFGLA